MRSTLFGAGVLAGLLMASGLAMGQASAPGAARGRMPCADVSAGASAPSPGCGPRRMGGMGGMGPRSGPGWTPGWSMMSAEERREHHDRLAAAKTYDECRAEMDRHRQAMGERARTQGRPGPGAPRRDACAGLKPPKG